MIYGTPFPPTIQALPTTKHVPCFWPTLHAKVPLHEKYMFTESTPSKRIKTYNTAANNNNN